MGFHHESHALISKGEGLEGSSTHSQDMKLPSKYVTEAKTVWRNNKRWYWQCQQEECLETTAASLPIISMAEVVPEISISIDHGNPPTIQQTIPSRGNFRIHWSHPPHHPVAKSTKLRWLKPIMGCLPSFSTAAWDFSTMHIPFIFHSPSYPLKYLIDPIFPSHLPSGKPT